MYPVKLGFDEAKNRIGNLIKNGHHAEALLTSVFTFEKILHRTLKQLMVSAGLRSKDAKLLIEKTKGFNNQKEIWPIFEPNNRKLPEIIGNTHWQHIGKAVKMRNKLVHGARVYNLTECMETAKQIVALLDQTVDRFKQEYGYDGWSRVSVRIKAVLHSDPKVRVKDAYRDRDAPHRAPLPHHAAYGSVLRGSADQAGSDPGEHKSK